MCPYISGNYPSEKYPSTVQNQGILLHLDGSAPHMYGKAAYEARDACAWPVFASIDDLRGLPPVFVSLNECDPLKDEGLEFYRKCLQAGVPHYCGSTLPSCLCVCQRWRNRLPAPCTCLLPLATIMQTRKRSCNNCTAMLDHILQSVKIERQDSYGILRPPLGLWLSCNSSLPRVRRSRVVSRGRHDRAPHNII